MTSRASEPRGADAYESVATEYYDAVKHPTCANFRLASELFLRPRILRLGGSRSRWCEVGCGDSLAASLAVDLAKPLANILLTDGSLAMLRYSDRWVELGATAMVANATQLPTGSSVVDLLIASLGDAYNVPSFWHEVERILSTAGLCLFTSPSQAWAHAFRNGHPLHDQADFEVGGTLVRLPSYIYGDDDQLGMITASGLEVVEQAVVTIGDLGGAVLSPKLIPLRGPNAAVVSGWVVRRNGAMRSKTDRADARRPLR